MKSVPLILCFFVLIGAFICESNADDNDNNNINEVIEEYRTVETKTGKIRGIKTQSSLNGIPYYSFKGIRYANPPIGSLRFKAPVPIDPWTDTLDAFEHISGCIRTNNPPFKDRPQSDDGQSEDCLALNVYVPESASPHNKLPVLFVIHGGLYVGLSGNTDTLGPDYLIETDVIIVTINYRLGIFGFLSLNTTEYSGNMGLKDQQLALKWTYENIEQFHGDPTKITVLGHSSGAASAHFHVLSTESNKYISKAILSSGTAASIWAMSEKNDHSELLYTITSEMGVAKTSTAGLINFLKTVPATKLMGFALPKITFYNTLDFAFVPVIERIDAIDPFMVRDPMETYKDFNVNIDVLFSITQSEMAAFYNTYSLLYPQFVKMNKNFTLRLPFRQSVYSQDSDEYQQLVNQVRDFYFEDKKIGPKTTQEYIDMISDMNFDYPHYKSIKMHMQYSNGKAFSMRFSVNATMNWMKRAFSDKTLYAEHMSDTCYTFHCHKLPYHTEVFTNFKSDESRVSVQTIRLMTKIYSNFVKYGHPSYNDDPIQFYQPIECFDIHTLDITNDGPVLDMNIRKNEQDFWDELEQKALGLIPIENKLHE